MDKRNGFWQVYITLAAKELLASVTTKGRVFRWKNMPCGVPNAIAFFDKLTNKKNLYILRCRPLVQDLVFLRAEIQAQIDDVSPGTKTQEDHILLLQEFFTVCQENHVRIKLEKCEFMRQEMESLGFHIAYGWSKPPCLRCNPCRTCRYVMTLRRVFMTFRVLSTRAIFNGSIYTILHIHQPP